MRSATQVTEACSSIAKKIVISSQPNANPPQV
jgi:hypothetical protein